MIVEGTAAALLSAVTQATPHAMLKAGRDKLAIRGLIALTCAAAVAPLAPFVPPPSAELWAWLALAGLLHTVYQLVLVRAYEVADFSVAYPLARGLVPVSTTAVGVLLLSDRLTAAAATGVATVTAGLLLIATRSGVRARQFGWAAAAGLLTTAYTVVDGRAVRLAPEATTFIIWYFVVEAAMVVPLVAWLRRGRVVALARAEGRQGVLAGLASLVTYGSALVALRLLPVGAASALRETSPVFGALIARYALGEAVDARRAAGIALIAGGGMLVVAGLAR